MVVAFRYKKGGTGIGYGPPREPYILVGDRRDLGSDVAGYHELTGIALHPYICTVTVAGACTMYPPCVPGVQKREWSILVHDSAFVTSGRLRFRGAKPVAAILARQAELDYQVELLQFDNRSKRVYHMYRIKKSNGLPLRNKVIAIPLARKRKP